MVGNAVHLTITVASGVARTILLDPWVSVWEVVSHASKQLYARASQTWPRFTSILSQIWNTLERVFHTTSHWERIRRGLPPLLANVAPPPPTDVEGCQTAFDKGSAEYLIGQSLRQNTGYSTDQ